MTKGVWHTKVRQLLFSPVNGWVIWLALGVTPMAAASLSFDSYPNATEMYDTEVQTDDYLLTLGALKKINNIWRAENERRLQGALRRTTWELPSGHRAEEGHEHYLTQLQALGNTEGGRLEQLFVCRARGCGSSNSWANNRFNVKQLYGLDRFQRYDAYRLVHQQVVYYVALYSVRRGNKRAYTHLEVLRSDESAVSVVDTGEASGLAPEIIVASLQAQGYVSLPLSDEGELLTPAAQLAAALAGVQWGSQSLAVVGHDYGRGTEKERQARSLLLAQGVAKQLTDAGLETQRLQVHAVGGLAPVGKGAASVRVDLVVLPQG